MPGKSYVSALQPCGNTSAQDRSGEYEEYTVKCEELIIKNEPEDEDEFIAEEDRNEEEYSNHQEFCNNYIKEEEQLYEPDTDGGGAKRKEFEAVVTEVYLPEIKEEPEDEFMPAGRDPLEDSPIHTTEYNDGDGYEEPVDSQFCRIPVDVLKLDDAETITDDPETITDEPETITDDAETITIDWKPDMSDVVVEEPVNGQFCRRIHVDILKLDGAESITDVWKPEVTNAGMETDVKPEIANDDILKKALMLSDINDDISPASYSQTYNDSNIGSMCTNINGNVSDCSQVNGANSLSGNVITNGSLTSLASNGFTYRKNAEEGVSTDINNENVSENGTSLLGNDKGGVPLVVQNCRLVLRNNDNLISPVDVQDCSAQQVIVSEEGVTLAEKQEGEPLNLVYECRICKKRFNKKSNLKVHEQYHVQDEKFKCIWCGMAFSQIEKLIIHNKLHVGETIYKCFLCARVYVRCEQLKLHMVKHALIKPHECDVCGRGYGKSVELKRHMITHTKEKSYQSNHKGSRPFACKFCPKRFIHSGFLHRHLKSHNKELIVD